MSPTNTIDRHRQLPPTTATINFQGAPCVDQPVSIFATTSRNQADWDRLLLPVYSHRQLPIGIDLTYLDPTYLRGKGLPCYHV